MADTINRTGIQGAAILGAVTLVVVGVLRTVLILAGRDGDAALTAAFTALVTVLIGSLVLLRDGSQ